MHPVNEVSFKKDEIGKMVFYNLDAFFNPVKTSNFMGGLEFDKYSSLIKEINNITDYPDFDPDLYLKIIKDKNYFIMPGVVKGTGQFPDSSPRVIENGREFSLGGIESGDKVPEFLRDPGTAYAVLNLSLAIQTKITLERAGVKDGVSIFVEGGFRKNKDYNSLLTALFPGSYISLTSMNEATAFGAALLGKAAIVKKDIRSLKDSFSIEFQKVTPIELKGFDAYIQKFLERL
jgi:hypothetical protein